MLKGDLEKLEFYFGDGGGEEGRVFLASYGPNQNQNLTASWSVGSLGGQAQSWVSFGVASTNLTTRGRQSLGNRKETRERKRFP